LPSAAIRALAKGPDGKVYFFLKPETLAILFGTQIALV